MALLERVVSFSSLSDHKENQYAKNFTCYSQRQLENDTFSSGPKNVIQDCKYSFSNDSEFLAGYGSDDDHYIAAQQAKVQPVVNLKNVISGIAAILKGRNKGLASIQPQQNFSSSVSFLEYEKDGGSILHSSVCIPSAPPLLQPEAINYHAFRDVLEAEPPEWLPDSFTTICMQCSAPFTALTRGRHHCRFCGGVFCKACTRGRCLLPVKFRMRDPQRVCDMCFDRLDPLQSILVNSISNAAQSAKHDVTDWTCTRAWLNLPVGLSMEHEIYKAANTLRSYSLVARQNREKAIPQAVLKDAKGLAILTMVKAGTILSYKFGTGLVVSRRSDGTWSAPSAILSVGLGWGAQIGGELMDFIVILRDYETVKTFCSRMHCSLGAGLSAAAGPVGRVLEADLRAGYRGSGMCYTYSCSKGAFVGVSMEGNVVVTRMQVNLRFYGDPYLTITDILLGTVERPKAAAPLYSALDDLYSNL
ncbi:1-phosphatidylinositol-3-phosphate 5-kinase FAB1A [Apostasia shenzhenica]|uniref:1-phosphatidylinositol-3-phosphate 5-kinase FAB1A n=1 Tax=Apostasia shenzhenica TaxID=1088818 RepID=A0A2I0A9U7_9ASPA|nr:1-phosphatidylinositol-3-phosphate 5-kinase FAB1A [Apostasia shenzhenica]